MHPTLADDRDHLPDLIALASAYATDVLEHLDSAPVAAPPQAHAAATLTPAGIGAQEALRRFREDVAPSLATSAGPRYLGFVTGGTTPAALLGDWLAAVFDQNPVSRLDGATALQLERDTVMMLRTLFGLPVAFAGSFVSGATMSNFVGLALAREWAGRTHGIRVSDEGLGALPRIAVLAATPHSSSTKALSMLGLGRSAWQKVACLPDREAMDLAALERHLTGVSSPCAVIASAGMVNTGDFIVHAYIAQPISERGTYDSFRTTQHRGRAAQAPPQGPDRPLGRRRVQFDFCCHHLAGRRTSE